MPHLSSLHHEPCFWLALTRKASLGTHGVSQNGSSTRHGVDCLMELAEDGIQASERHGMEAACTANDDGPVPQNGQALHMPSTRGAKTCIERIITRNRNTLPKTRPSWKMLTQACTCKKDCEGMRAWLRRHIVFSLSLKEELLSSLKIWVPSYAASYQAAAPIHRYTLWCSVFKHLQTPFLFVLRAKFSIFLHLARHLSTRFCSKYSFATE